MSTVLVETPPDTPLLSDRLINKKVYRLLDIPYYCWLRSRIDRAIDAVDARKITISIFDRLCVAFDRVHRWAVTHLDQEDLLQTFITFKPEGYIAPRINRQGECISSFAYPKEGCWRFEHPVTASAIYKVEQIRAQALTLGWSEQNLFQNRSNELRHPFGGHWGLVTLLRPDYRIGQVTHETIELIGPKPFENVMRFQNPGFESTGQQKATESCEQKEQYTARPVIAEFPRLEHLNPIEPNRQAHKQSIDHGRATEKRQNKTNTKIKSQLVLFDL